VGYSGTVAILKTAPLARAGTSSPKTASMVYHSSGFRAGLKLPFRKVTYRTLYPTHTLLIPYTSLVGSLGFLGRKPLLKPTSSLWYAERTAAGASKPDQ
jgi:hypothetical protein